MEQRTFGSTGMKIPVIGQGTWMMEHDGPSAVEALRHGIDLGMTHIDTAELYGSGRVEELVGEAIAGRRDEVFLASKVMPGNASRRGTIEACERSLRRLDTDRLDLYLLHWPSRYPLEDTIGAFEELERAGKIQAFGVSNFDADQLERAIDLAGPHRIACNQVLYHLGERQVEHDLLPLCKRSHVSLVGYSPFAQGSFRFTHPVLTEIARARGATPRQVTLRFLIREPAVFTIPKSSSPKHVEQNSAAAEFDLSEEEIARIDAAFPLGRRRRGLRML